MRYARCPNKELMPQHGPTRIGKYLLNHSFMISGFIGVVVSTVVACMISRVVF